MEPIQNIQTKDYIINAIRREILAGHMIPGEELTQEALAAQLGVSRMPVREALQALEQEGFLERLPNRHMRVVAIQPEHIRSIFRTIAGIEKELASLVCNNSLSLEGLQLQLDALKQEDFGRELDFHRQLAKLTGNKYLEQLHTKLLEGYVDYVLSKPDYDRHRAAQKLQMIVDTMGASQLEELCNHIDSYYLDLSRIMIEKQEESIHE